MVVTHSRGLITRPITTHEPPSTVSFFRGSELKSLDLGLQLMC